MSKWEMVTATQPDDYMSRYHPNGVRRMRAPTGWIYQFEKGCRVDEFTERVVGREWGGETFVPAPAKAKATKP
jgi:hypothetical protein